MTFENQGETEDGPDRWSRLTDRLEYLERQLKEKDATLKETEDRLDWAFEKIEEMKSPEFRVIEDRLNWALRKVDQLLQGRKV